jgi:hypothetical protein
MGMFHPQEIRRLRSGDLSALKRPMFRLAVDVKLTAGTGNQKLQGSARIDRGDDCISLGINHGQLAKIPVNDKTCLLTGSNAIPLAYGL